MFKDLERENARQMKLVADLALEKTMLKELASPNWSPGIGFESPATQRPVGIRTGRTPP